MGGMEASRGFFYQGVASLLTALSGKQDWDKIYVEFPINGDKVDIALERNGQIIKIIQVKSTVNIFSKSDLVKWMYELVSDKNCPEYELFLMGQCNNSAITFINSINKYYDHKIDKTAEQSLKDFDKEILKNRKVKFKAHFHEIDDLKAIVRDSLYQYMLCDKSPIEFDQLDFIASAMVNDQMISSTHGKGIDRKTFDEKLKCRISLLAQNAPKRLSIGIKTFVNKSRSSLEDETDCCLSFADKFEEGRWLKDGFDWDEDIYRELERFLFDHTDDKSAYQILFDALLSIAFASGRILNSKTGVNIFPVQRGRSGTELWDVKKQSTEKNYSVWVPSYEKVVKNENDCVLILNTTRSIYEEVKNYIRENDLAIGQIINCVLSEKGATNGSILDGNHANALANSVCEILSKRSVAEQRATLHIFASAPAGFVFFLGQNSTGFGKCVFYEYDFDKHRTCTYLPSMYFIK